MDFTKEEIKHLLCDNMNKNLLIKTLAVGVIFLFIAVGFQPAFAINIDSVNKIGIENGTACNDKSEYIIQIVQTDEIIEHTVYLTEEEANDLENLIDSIKSDFNSAETEEEINQIYLDSAISFKDLGLLPEDVSVDEVKQIMTGEDRDLENIRFKNEMGEGIENRLCFVTSDTTLTYTFGPMLLTAVIGYIPLVVYGLFVILISQFIDPSQYELLNLLLNVSAYFVFGILAASIILSLLSLDNRFPVSIGSIITFGRYYQEFPNEPRYYYPSEGSISTFGLNGIKSLNKNFYGSIYPIGINSGAYIGIVGFTGINIIKLDSNVFRLGFALHVKVNTSHLS